jgi:hypothetical protein
MYRVDYKPQPYYFFCIFLSLYAVYHFFVKGGSAFEWPALDMGPFLERTFHPDFIPNDFFTNTSSDISPRQIYGYFVVGMAKMLNTDLYGIFFLIELLYAAFIYSFSD